MLQLCSAFEQFSFDLVTKKVNNNGFISSVQLVRYILMSSDRMCTSSASASFNYTTSSVDTSGLNPRKCSTGLRGHRCMFPQENVYILAPKGAISRVSESQFSWIKPSNLRD